MQHMCVGPILSCAFADDGGDPSKRNGVWVPLNPIKGEGGGLNHLLDLHFEGQVMGNEMGFL